jgi:MOB kinase activator 1
MMQWAESQLNDPSVFPPNSGAVYPKDFRKKAGKLFQRFFRVYAHLYHEHFRDLLQLGAEGIINTCFKHFLFFAIEFDLVLSHNPDNPNKPN